MLDVIPRKMALRDVRLVQALRPFEYHSPFADEEHTLLLCVVDDSVTSSERFKLAAEIVAAKCRYAVCWGHECSAWDTAIDCAHIATDEDFNPPDETFVMTTWHDEESIEDTIEFWWMSTSFDDYDSTRLAILILGDDAGLAAKMVAITTDLMNHWNSQEPETQTG